MDDPTNQPPGGSLPPSPPKPRRGRKAGQPPATHSMSVPVETMAPIHEVAALTGQKPAELLTGFRDFLAQALIQLAAQYAAQRLAEFEKRLTAKKAEMQAAAGGGQ